MPQHLDHEETCLVYASSEHATARSTDGHRFTVNMGNTTFAEKASGITLNKVILPNVFPNINAYRNTFLVGLTTVTIPVGFYDAGEIVTIVNAQLAGAAEATMAFANNRFSFTNIAGGPLLISVTAVPEVWEWLGWDWRAIDALTGLFDGLYQITITDGATVTAPHNSGLHGEKLVHISCDKLSHSNLVHGADGKLHDILCTVPLGETVYNFIKVWEPLSEKSYRINYKYVNSISSTLEFRVLDSRMRPLPFSPNAHLQIVLKVYHKEHD